MDPPQTHVSQNPKIEKVLRIDLALSAGLSEVPGEVWLLKVMVCLLNIFPQCQWNNLCTSLVEMPTL